MEKTEMNTGILKTIEYDEETRELHVHFQNGDYVIYYEVYKLDYVGFLSSNDYTNFFKERIEPRFPSRTITP
ncbi:KTSC domain-containing protein [Evansella sp. AB-rgal1]|uniref:KTSC domain-containing protein n=1 Tax=Evansella sp. AB-rgal1 TaxID=3242696 RepID=UPI00359CFB60